MPLSLIPPGTRKNNRFWLVRGRDQHGRLVELSTKTQDKSAAKQFLRDLVKELAKEEVPAPGKAIDFETAARLYAAKQGVDLDQPKLNPPAERADAYRILKLISRLGRRPIGELRHPDLVAAAVALYPRHAPSTRNREAMRPAAAILHYAAESGYCAWLKVELFDEPEPETRAVDHDAAETVIAAAPDLQAGGPKYRLLLWLFCHGTRITQTLGIGWEHVSLVERTFRLYDKKAGKWQYFPIDDEVFEELCRVPEAERRGKLFPWHTKSGVYIWLRPVRKRLRQEFGLDFTPHMARHSVGTWFNAQGEGLKTIMAKLGHRSERSSLRYTAADVRIVRAASAKRPRLTTRPAGGSDEAASQDRKTA